MQDKPIPLCKCGHEKELHQHYSESTKCSVTLSAPDVLPRVYCKCKGYRRKFLWFWI